MSEPSVRTVKFLPCDRCGDAMLRDGKPYTMGRHPFGKFPLRVFCAQCKRPTLLSQQRWAALPWRDIAVPAVPEPSEPEPAA